MAAPERIARIIRENLSGVTSTDPDIRAAQEDDLMLTAKLIAADLCASGQQARAAAQRILELYDDAMRDLLDPGAHDTHPDSDELAELRKIVGAPAHSWTPAPAAPKPKAQVMDGWVDDKTFIEPISPTASSPQPSETVAEAAAVILSAIERAQIDMTILRKFMNGEPCAALRALKGENNADHT